MENSTRVIFRQFEDVVLRPVEEIDVPRHIRWANDKDVTRYLSLYLPMNSNDEKEWVQKIRATGKDVILTIEYDKENSTPIPVGLIGLHGIHLRHRTATLGIMIGEKEYWGNRIGEKAIKALLEYAFYTLNLHKVNLSLYSKNERAKKLYIKCGFVVEGALRENRYIDGEYTDETLMAVFKKDWMASQSKK